MGDTMSLSPFALWPTVAMVVAATFTDVRSGRIPDRLTLPFFVLGFVSSGFAHGWSGVWQSVLGVLAAAIVTGFFCFLRGMGMGDLKLCVAVGAWIGPSQVVLAMVLTGLAGGAIAVCWALAGGFLWQALRGTVGLVAGFARKGLKPHETLALDNPLARKMPYAPAIAIGTICSFVGRH
jgi:prepilin peptidase CpaA